jgi:hypothetical protein
MKLFHYAAPQHFYPLAGRLWPVLALLATALALAGLWVGFMVAPSDAQQGQAYRIIYIHVPVSWMAMIIYLAMAFWSVLGLVFNTRLSGLMTRALAPTGALLAFLSLWTGALWGKPMWGTYWVWDARLTSMLILRFLYLGYIALTSAIEDPRRSDRAGALVAVVGAGGRRSRLILRHGDALFAVILVSVPEVQVAEDVLAGLRSHHPHAARGRIDRLRAGQHFLRRVGEYVCNLGGNVGLEAGPDKRLR